MLYKRVLKPILFQFDPEDVHDLFILFGQLLGKFKITRWATDLMYGYHKLKNEKVITKVVDGITYKTPIILSAGFDYNARLTDILPYVGFGGEEVGSVTARKCSGNPKPRLKRLPKSGSIVVNKGLRNDGVDTIITRLKRNESRFKKFVIGISIAKTNDAKAAESIQSSIDDYLYSFKRLNEENIGDFYTINISCPNAFSGETFIKPALLELLLIALKSVECSKPVYAKMPINLSWDKFDELLKIIDRHGLNGVVIGNLNKDYSLLEEQSERPAEYIGGLSGETCSKLSTELIKKTRQYYGKRFTIMGVGGIMSADDAMEKFEAGADLVQLISGMIFEGPSLMKKICREYSKKC